MFGGRKDAGLDLQPLEDAEAAGLASLRRLSAATFALGAHQRFWQGRTPLPTVELFKSKQALWAQVGSLLEQYSAEDSTLTVEQMRYELDSVYVELDRIHDTGWAAPLPTLDELRKVTDLMRDA